jgi:hypothetical protein
MLEPPVSSKDGSRPHFELNVSLPTDPRFTGTARELAVHAAMHAGCVEARARAFGEEVEGVIRGYLEDGGTGPSLPLVFRRRAGPVEALINGRTIAIEP